MNSLSYNHILPRFCEEKEFFRKKSAMKHAFILSALALLFTVGAANAQTITAAPNTMNFQGRLAKQNGTPLADGVHTVTFRIYDAQTGGNVKWAEQIGSLNTKNGAFSAVLGKIFPFNDAILNGAVWLEIQIESDAPLIPRQQFQSVAYALKANTVPDGAITTAKIADGAITVAKLASAANFGVGVPSGYKILGDTPAPPGGYTFSGESLSGDGTWAAQTSLPSALASPGSAVFNNKIYLFGGYTGSYLNTVSVYDPAASVWSAKTPMPTARQFSAAVVLNGKIHVLGGSNANARLAAHEIYDPVSDTWQTGAPLPAGVEAPGAVAYNNQIFVIGGSNGSNNLTTNYVYDDASASWTTKAPLPTGVTQAGVAAIGATIYVMGGFSSNGVVGLNQVYDISSNTWTTKAPMLTPRMTTVAAVVNGKINVIGGWTGSARSGANEEYDPIQNVWRVRTAMPAPRSNMGFGIVNNSIYLLGGLNASGGLAATNEVYTPEKIYYLFTKQ